MSCRTRCCAALLALTAFAFGACSTQRWPAPMGGVQPAAASAAEAGPLEAQVLRHADPVEVRPAGRTGSYPLRFYGKKERLKSGGMLLVGAGGKAEVLWPGEYASALFLGEGLCVIGEPSRGEPSLQLLEVDSARLMLTPSMRIELPGGAQLAGDPALDVSGPYLVERQSADVVRVRNQSRTICSVAYRDEAIELAPGQLVDLAILDRRGSAPLPEHEQLAPPAEPAPGVHVSGNAQSSLEAGELSVRASASEPASVSAQGVLVHLAAGERVRLAGLGRASGARSTAEPAAAAPADRPAAAATPSATPSAAPATAPSSTGSAPDSAAVAPAESVPAQSAPAPVESSPASQPSPAPATPQR